mgnify:CR=1 FL=1
MADRDSWDALRAERMTLGDKMEKELGVQPGRGMMGNGMMGNGGCPGMAAMSGTPDAAAQPATTGNK